MVLSFNLRGFAALSLLVASMSALEAHSETLSEKIHAQIMAYHSPRSAASKADGIRRPSRPSTEWVFSKGVFLQYVKGLSAFSERIYSVAADFRVKATLTETEYAALLTAIEFRALPEAILGDLPALLRSGTSIKRIEHIELTPAARQYDGLLLFLQQDHDPIPLLIAAYIVFYGHDFGVKNFLRRANALRLGKMPMTEAYPPDGEKVGNGIRAVIDAVDNRLDARTREARHASYMSGLARIFKAQQKTLEDLAGESFSSTSSSSSSSSSSFSERPATTSSWTPTILYSGAALLIAAILTQLPHITAARP